MHKPRKACTTGFAPHHKTMIKDFDLWSQLKKKIDLRNGPIFAECEIWWCSLGINIGHEENGKNELFNRPILVVRKFNRHIFLGIPLTTKIKNNRFYYRFIFRGKIQCAMLSQIRVWESRRLTNRIGEISLKELEIIRKEIKKII